MRWFVAEVRASTTKARRTYRNPIALALEWRRAVDRGYYSSQADLARRKNISRARVTQILNLLRLSPRVIGIVRDLGDPLPSRTITERQLRRIINLPSEEQLKELNIIIARMHKGRKPTHHS